MSAASEAIGFGHLRRSISLADNARQLCSDIQIAVLGDEEAASQVKSAGFECIAFGDLREPLAEQAFAGDSRFDCITLDVPFDAIGGSYGNPRILFRGLHRIGRLLVAFDGLGEASISQELLRDTEVDIAVRPYVMQSDAVAISHCRLLQGPKYAVLPSRFAKLPVRQQRVAANRILVTCGGSDPRSLTLSVLQGLQMISRPLCIRVVVGPLFSNELRKKVLEMVQSSRHDVQVVLAPATLLDEMLWCDLAIGTNGLTKYELAASGTPAILFPIDNYHHEVNRPFADMKTAMHLQVGVSAHVIAVSVTTILNDFASRCAMAAKGVGLVDGRGGERIFQEIAWELPCLKDK